MAVINAGCIGEGPCWEDLHPDEAAEIAWRIRAEENTIPIVDLNEIKPVQFNKTQVYDELNRVNNGGAVDLATVVKMLKQLHYIMTEYESLRFCVDSEAREIIRNTRKHLKLTSTFYSDKWGRKEGGNNGK